MENGLHKAWTYPRYENYELCVKSVNVSGRWTEWQCECLVVYIGLERSMGSSEWRYQQNDCKEKDRVWHY